MSMHHEPLTDLERAGLTTHHLPIGVPSQLSDAFRDGMRWYEDSVPPHAQFDPSKEDLRVIVDSMGRVHRAVGAHTTELKCWTKLLEVVNAPQQLTGWARDVLIEHLKGQGYSVHICRVVVGEEVGR